MSTQTRKKKHVEFKTEKTFGDLIGMPFAFFFQEFKLFSIALLKYAGPFVALAFMILGLMSNDFIDLFKNSSEPTPAFFGYLFLVVLIFNLGVLAIVTVTYSYASVYEKHGRGNFSIADVGKLLKKSVFKIFAGGLLMGLMIIPVILIAIIPVFGILAIIFGSIYLSVSLSLFAVIIVHEEVGIFEAISRSFKLIKGAWWKTFGLYIVFYFIIAFSSYAFLIPIYIIIFAVAFSGSAMGAGSIVLIVFFVIIYFVGYMYLMTLQQFLITFQYFNLRVQKEGTSLTDRISAINDNIKQEGDIFEVKDETFSDDIKEQKEEPQNEKKEDIIPENKEEEPKIEDEWSKLLDDKEKKNRFEEGDDENDRFKPKY